MRVQVREDVCVGKHNEIIEVFDREGEPNQNDTNILNHHSQCKQNNPWSSNLISISDFVFAPPVNLYGNTGITEEGKEALEPFGDFFDDFGYGFVLERASINNLFK